MVLVGNQRLSRDERVLKIFTTTAYSNPSRKPKPPNYNEVIIAKQVGGSFINRTRADGPDIGAHVCGFSGLTSILLVSNSSQASSRTASVTEDNLDRVPSAWTMDTYLNQDSAYERRILGQQTQPVQMSQYLRNWNASYVSSASGQDSGNGRSHKK